MGKVCDDIQEYILFLRQKGYYVSFSSFDEHFHPYTEQLLQHEIHLHSICSFMKTNPATAGMCVNNKAKLARCKIQKPCYCCCYAGVEEYIFPVYCNNLRIICIHISGYRDHIRHSKKLKEKIAKRCSPVFLELYSQLSPDPPSHKVVGSFIKPLEYMLRELYVQSQGMAMIQKPLSAAEQMYVKALYYINDNYMNDISAGMIAGVLGYSESYLRAIFKQFNGSSLQNKIKDVRLENAKFLLSNTTMNVTDVAFHCGFSDSNYFSVVFKRKYGVSPLGFKKGKSEMLL